MENDNKNSSFKRIILIVLMAILISGCIVFTFLSPIACVCRDKLVDNNTQLVKKDANGDGTHFVDQNGNLSIISYNKVVTIYNSWNSFEIAQDVNYYNSLINGDSISGINDTFGFGNFNYFRFKYNTTYSDKLVANFENVYELQYFIQLTNDTFYTFTLGYYEIFLDDFIYFTPIKDMYFELNNLIPSYDILNFSYFNSERLNQLREFIQLKLGANNLLYIWSDFQIDNRFYDAYSTNTFFYNFDKDFITSLLNSATSSSYQDGYNKGYNVGLDDASANSVFSILKKGVSSINELLNIEVLPNVSLWLLMSIPLSISMMVIMFKLLRGD